MNISLTVAELFNPQTGDWYDPMLRSLFHYSEFNIIKNIKPRIGFPDSYLWTKTRNEIYSVKTGYELMFRLAHKDLVELEEALPSRNHVLQGCWNVKTVPKIKVFLWKALKGALAVTDRLRSRGIQIFDGCMFCGADKETINHILFLCPFARIVWALSNIPSPSMGFGYSIFQNMYHLFNLRNSDWSTHDSAETFAWVLWHLWKNRNSMLFDCISLSPDFLIQKAMDNSRDWSVVHSPNLLKPVDCGFPLHNWCPPLLDEVKCNIGFSWSRRASMSGASWVVRDSLGNVLLHSRRSYARVYSAFEAKIKSWEWALESMSSLHMEKVIFGASTLEIIQALHSPNQWPAFVGHISPLTLLSSNKPNWLLSFEPTKANFGASLIATSVTEDLRLNSYVSRGYPSWLKGFFDEEKKLVLASSMSDN